MSNLKGFEAAQSIYEGMSQYEEECEQCEDMQCAEHGSFITASKTTVHTARKDHFNSYGRLIVKKGRKYKKHYQHGYTTDYDGSRVGFKNIFKVAVKLSFTVPE